MSQPNDPALPLPAAASLPDVRPHRPAAACMRVELGSVRRLANGAWLHRFGDGPGRPSPRGPRPAG